ncbi:MAG: CDP-glycerol glycerophosphotransferase family protein [Massilibacteroides sp.]|nr:CDP-glycerol glycerophosphotransferase family protein [Massilibacteroides sp.]
MKVVLFCENTYAIGILYPLELEARKQNYRVKWYLHQSKIYDFKYEQEVDWTYSMQEIYNFNPDAIFVPGNIVPYYLPGIKVQIFHGYAAEKQGHFKIRGYFDLYFTQGPYFTKRFEALKTPRSNFEIMETGWTKQDWIKAHLYDFEEKKKALLGKYNKKQIVLYAPTFSPRFTSLGSMEEILLQFIEKNDVLLLLKFHALTAPEYVKRYKALAAKHASMIWINDPDVAKYLLLSDLMISDTSSVIYEFLLLDKPVITLNTNTKNPKWINIDKPEKLDENFQKAFDDEETKANRQWFRDYYDPYFDGNVCARMFDNVEKYKQEHGIPLSKRMNLWRKYTCIKTFGKIKR